MLARVYTCQKATLLEIICRGSYVFNYCMVTHNWYFFIFSVDQMKCLRNYSVSVQIAIIIFIEGRHIPGPCL